MFHLTIGTLQNKAAAMLIAPHASEFGKDWGFPLPALPNQQELQNPSMHPPNPHSALRTAKSWCCWVGSHHGCGSHVQHAAQHVQCSTAAKQLGPPLPSMPLCRGAVQQDGLPSRPISDGDPA